MGFLRPFPSSRDPGTPPTSPRAFQAKHVPGIEKKTPDYIVSSRASRSNLPNSSPCCDRDYSSIFEGYTALTDIHPD